MVGMNRRLVCVFISQPDCPLPSSFPMFFFHHPSLLRCAAFSIVPLPQRRVRFLSPGVAVAVDRACGRAEGR